MVSLKPNFPLHSYSRELLIVLLPSCIPLIFFFSFLLVVSAFPVTCKAVHSSLRCVAHTFAVGFPMSLPVCRFPHAFLHLFLYEYFTYIHLAASLLFLVRSAIRCSKHFSRQNSVRLPPTYSLFLT